MGKLKGKTVAIVVANEFEDVELLYPLLRLSEEGAEVILVPVPGKPVTGRFGTRVPIGVMAEGKRHTLSTVEDLDAETLNLIMSSPGERAILQRHHINYCSVCKLAFCTACVRKAQESTGSPGSRRCPECLAGECQVL